MADDGILNQAIASQFELTVGCLSSIITARSILESFETPAPLGKNLNLGDELHVLHLMDLHNNKSLGIRIFKID